KFLTLKNVKFINKFSLRYMQLCIFEDKRTSNFFPLTYSRPVYDLLFGFSTLKDKILNTFPGYKVSLHCRNYLSKINAQNNPGLSNSIENSECLFINGRVIADNHLLKLFSKKKRKENIVFVKEDTLVAAYLSGT